MATEPTLIMHQAAIDADRAGWLKRRTDGITGTDVATLLGLSAHMSAYGLYHAKLDGIETGDKPVMRRGRKLEPEVDDLLVDEFPWFDPRTAGLYAHDGEPWMMATLDRWLLDSEAASALDREHYGHGVLIDAAIPAEYKTWATKDGWIDPGRGVIGDGNRPGSMPVGVRCQSIWNMHIAGRDRILVVVLFMTSWQVGVYEITAGDAGVQRDLAVMIAAARRFRRQLADRDEPDVDDHPATTDTLRKLHPSLVDESVRIPVALWLRYQRARAAEQRAKSRIRLAQNQLRERMGPAARAHVIIRRDPPEQDRMITVCSRSVGDHPVKAHTRHDDKLTPGRITSR